MTTNHQLLTKVQHSPAPWSYEYNPYQISEAAAKWDASDPEIPAFEIFDADCNKIFDTNEDTPAELQEANARLATLAPELLAALRAFVEIDELAKECGDWRREHLAEAFATARQLIQEAAS